MELSPHSMNGLGVTTGEGDDMPYDVNMKLALIGDSGTCFRKLR